MKSRLYTITGIPVQMVKSDFKEFRDDIKLFKQDNDNFTARLFLTKLQAMTIRLQIIQYNLTHPCVLKLVKLGAKRYRV